MTTLKETNKHSLQIRSEKDAIQDKIVPLIKINKLEDNKSVSKTTDAVDMQLDDYHLQRLRELGLDGENPTDEDDPYNLVSYR